MVTHACNPSTAESEAGKMRQVWGQPGLYSEIQVSQANIVGLCLGKPKNSKNTTNTLPQRKAVYSASEMEIWFKSDNLNY